MECIFDTNNNDYSVAKPCDVKSFDEHRKSFTSFADDLVINSM